MTRQQRTSELLRDRSWRPRPAVLFGVLLSALLVLLLTLASPWSITRDLAPARAVVRWLALTDLCLTTESPAARNPALADPVLPLQLVAGGPDLFPAPPFFDLTVRRTSPQGGRIWPGPSVRSGAR